MKEPGLELFSYMGGLCWSWRDSKLVKNLNSEAKLPGEASAPHLLAG